MIKRLTVLTLLFLKLNTADAQCLSDTSFNIDSLGNRSEKFYFPITMKIFPDSIKFINPKKAVEEFLSFSIVEKKSCQWNKDLSIGVSEYRLKSVLEDKILFPILRIVYESKLTKRVELLYDDSEERIFILSKN